MVELDVGEVAHGGHCVARHEGRVVFVRHALPTERVRARITEGREHDRYLRADAVEVLRASADRVEPPCPFAAPGRCGGCDWQHASLPAQRRLKADVVAEQLRRLAGLDVDVTVEPLPGAEGQKGQDDGLGWRTRVRYSVDPEGNAGLLRHRSHEVEPVDWCRIAHPLVTGVGATEHRWPGVSAVEVVASPSTGSRAVVASTREQGDKQGRHGQQGRHGRRAGKSKQPWQQRGSSRGRRVTFPPLPDDVSLLREDRGSGVLVRGAAELAEVAGAHRFTVAATGFWQVHPEAADALVAAVLEGLRPEPGESVLDLYAGAGLFAVALADRVGEGGRVVAVEAHPGAATDVRKNATGLPVHVERAPVDKFLRAASGNGELLAGGVDLVVLDPPRAGAGAAVTERIAALQPRRVCYVACDPAALARDLATFTASGYRLTSLRAFDLFPMTHHVEAVATLSGSTDAHQHR